MDNCPGRLAQPAVDPKGAEIHARDFVDWNATTGHGIRWPGNPKVSHLLRILIRALVLSAVGNPGRELRRAAGGY